MKILLIGKSGQIGYELEQSLQGLAEIIALDRHQMDLTDFDRVCATIRAVNPDIIINAAAYTDVEQAESEPELAMRINGEAPGVMAIEAKRIGAAMIHYSSDYVFDGNKVTPYTETDIACPINAYGRSKLAGESAVQAAGIPHLILRTSWVYGMRGKNFLLTVLRLAQQQQQLRIVDDQYGAPTWCRTVAVATAQVIAKGVVSQNRGEWWRQRSGIYNLTAQGQTSWYGFAQAILRNSMLVNIPNVTFIKTQDYPLLAERPRYSIMSCERLTKAFCSLPEWHTALKLCMS